VAEFVDDEMYEKKPQRYAKDNVTQGKSEASVTILKDSARVVILFQEANY